MKQLLSVLTIVLGLSSTSYAGMFIEPYLGYETGKIEGTFIPAFGGSTQSSDFKGTSLGARLGYQFVMPWVALDAKYFTGKTDDDPSDDLKTTDLGVTVGLSLPIVRPYAGYIVSSKTDIEDTEYKATGLKVGLGLKFLPIVEINLEHVMYTYTEVDGNSVDTFFSDLKSSSTMIALGVRF